MKAYPRGFILSREELILPEDLSHYILRNVSGINFYSDISTNTFISIKNDSFVILHGHACLYYEGSMEISGQVIADRLATEHSFNGESGVERTLFWLAGRYSVVVGETSGNFTVYHDAHGMRSVYFDLKNRIVSSHANLIEEISGVGKRAARLGPLWTAWDKTHNENIVALIPNHKLLEERFNQLRYYPRDTPTFADVSEEFRLEMVEKLWKMQLDAYITNHQIVLSVTGGLDSRAALALSVNHHKEMDSYTYTHETGTSNAAASWRKDKEVVAGLLEHISLRHMNLRYEDRIELNEMERAVADRNSLGLHGRWLIKLYPNVFSTPQSLHLRSNTHETARAYYPRNPNDDQIDMIGNIVASGRARQLGLNAEQRVAAKEEAKDRLKKFQYSTQTHWIEPLDLFYWEFRMGRWVSEVYNETDVAYETFTPFNMRAIIELSLGFSYDKRLNGFLFKELINRNLPILNFYGVNSFENLYEKYERGVLSNSKTQSKVNSVDSDGEIEMLKSSTTGLQFQITSSDGRTSQHTDTHIFLPLESLISGSTAQIERSVKPGNELTITYFNELSRAAAKGYLRYETLINGRLVETEDYVSNDKVQSVSFVNGTNVAIDVTFVVRVLRTCQAASWQKASRSWIRIDTVKATFEIPSASDSKNVYISRNGRRTLINA